MKTALVVKTTGEMYEIDISANSYDALKNEINGWLEAIDLKAGTHFWDATMWVDEEGKMKSLPHNLFAQKIFDFSFGAWRDSVVGDVVFTGGADQHGNTKGLSKQSLEMLRKQIMWVHDYLEPRIELIEIGEVK